jgi:hypothetical protein
MRELGVEQSCMHSGYMHAVPSSFCLASRPSDLSMGELYHVSAASRIFDLQT